VLQEGDYIRMSDDGGYHMSRRVFLHDAENDWQFGGSAINGLLAGVGVCRIPALPRSELGGSISRVLGDEAASQVDARLHHVAAKFGGFHGEYASWVELWVSGSV
jgi:hypothetical protein